MMLAGRMHSIPWSGWDSAMKFWWRSEGSHNSTISLHRNLHPTGTIFKYYEARVRVMWMKQVCPCEIKIFWGKLDVLIWRCLARPWMYSEQRWESFSSISSIGNFFCRSCLGDFPKPPFHPQENTHTLLIGDVGAKRPFDPCLSVRGVRVQVGVIRRV